MFKYTISIELQSPEWEMFSHIPKQAYVDPKWKGTTPYQVLREVGRGNTIRLRRCADILSAVAFEKEIDVEGKIQQIVHELPCRGGSIVELIEDALCFDICFCKMMSLQCGLGKSTAISYVIRDVLEYGEGIGLLVVTDSLERLKSYLTPTRDVELAKLLHDNESRITLIESTNKVEAMQRMRTTPILLMTTQRYFSMSPREIEDILKGDGFRRRYVIIDEKPILKTVETVSRADVNKVSSALCDGLRSYDNHEEKRQMIEFWEKIRAKLMADIQKCEDDHFGATPFFAAYPGMSKEICEDFDAFMETVDRYSRYLKKYDPECLGRISRIYEIVKNGGLIYGDSGQYYKSCFYAVANRTKLVSGVLANVLILDGTGDIHPDYDNQSGETASDLSIQMHTENLPVRRMENLTLRFVNVDASKSWLNNEDHKGIHKQAILRYLESLKINKALTPLFTYKDCENWFRNRGFERTGHFGDIKGRNCYADAANVVQVGINLFAQQDYLTLWLADHPKEREQILQLPPEELNQALIDLRKSADVIALQNRILLAELEQNMYRCAIRRRDFNGQAIFYVLCDTNQHSVLIDMARKRYESLGVTIDVVNETPMEFQQIKMERRKAKDPRKGTAPQRFMKWYQELEPGRIVTRKQILSEANLTASEFNNLCKKHRNGEYYNKEIGPLLESMRRGYNKYGKL